MAWRSDEARLTDPDVPLEELGCRWVVTDVGALDFGVVSGSAAAVQDDVEPVVSERRDRVIAGIVTAVPILSLFFVGWQLWASLLGWNDIFVFLLLYVLTGFGVTVGFHRLLTHRAFKTTRPIRAALAILGSAAIEGPVISWVADHRKHHAFADREGDPHSPHVDHGHGWRGALRGLLHAHVGWLFIHTHRGRRTRYAPDLLADPVVSWVDRTFAVWAFGGLLAAFGLGWLFGGTAARRPDGRFVGRRGADACGPPRDLQHQLAVPLLRAPALRHRR